MSNVKTVGSRLLAVFMALCLAAIMAIGAASLATPSKAFADEQAVRDTATGVMKFNWEIDGQDYSRGSCFLINDETVLTAYHCTFFSSAELAAYGYDGQDIQALRDRVTYSVTINRDVTVKAEMVNYSEDQDFAILKLSQKINNHTPLTLRDSSTVQAAEQVYSVGFPGASDVANVVTTYTSSDVTVKGGTVSKPEILVGVTTIIGNSYYWVTDTRAGYYIQTDINLMNGDSGGPLVDANGNVIGVNVMSNNSFAYGSATDVIIPVLSDLGIAYNSADGSTTVTTVASGSSASASSSAAAAKDEYKLSFTDLNAAISKAEGLDSSKYTPESYKAVTDALAAAKEALNTELKDATDKTAYEDAQKSVDDAAKALEDAVSGLKEVEQGPNMGLIIAIVVAAVVVIAIIVLLVVRSRKNKKQEDAPTVPLAGSQAAAPAAQPALQSGGSQSWQKPGAAAGAGAPETTILDDAASDTVILFQAASGGSLTRMSTNEQIPINSAEFAIGRERSKVNYCLEGNSSISRIHVRILVRDGKVYCVDNKAANGTYINGVKCRPGEEVLLKSGDIITLADEKFKYNA